MEQVFENKRDCCGCFACFNGCPVGAIEMIEDEEGFKYPKIDGDVCIDCGWCKHVCPFINSEELKDSSNQTLYRAVNKDACDLKKSTSGGAFSAISDVILEDGGYVFGAVFDEEFKIVHKEASTAEERDLMRKSKYAQSEIGETFKKVRTHLADGKKVLFTGTPCQVAGLKGFLNQLANDENLLLVDVICHSIPSPKVFRDYIKWIEKEENKKITWIDFRYKDGPWTRDRSNRGFKYKVEGSDEIKNRDFFYEMFFGWQTIMRPSCERCPFCDLNRVSDITIADFWGIEKYDESLYDERGVSSIMFNSKRGLEYFERIKEEADMTKRPLEESINEQGRLRDPVKYPKTRSEFWKDYEKIGLEGIINSNKKY